MSFQEFLCKGHLDINKNLQYWLLRREGEEPVRNAIYHFMETFVSLDLSILVNLTGKSEQCLQSAIVLTSVNCLSVILRPMNCTEKSVELLH